MSTDSVVVPLSGMDCGAGVESLLTVFCYVVAGQIDADAIHGAAVRVVDKWRLLAGKIEPEGDMYSVRVPTGHLNTAEPRLHFTTCSSAVPLPAVVQTIDDTSACTFAPPPYRFFVHKSTSGSLATLAKSGAPLLNIHVHAFTDYTCVGIATPHGVFDGVGQGLVTQFLDAELNGRAWVAPSYGPKSMVQQLLNKLNADEALYAETPRMLDNIKRELVPTSIRSLAMFVASMVYEYFWNQAETRAIFLGKDVVEKLVKKVKKDVQAIAPDAWVSTGDILYMWMVQTACNDEPEEADRTVSISSVASLRTTLSPYDKDFETYPHNCIMPFALPLYTKTALKRMELADLALQHRQGIAEIRNVPYVQAWSKHVEAVGRPCLPSRRLGHDSWTSSNQVVGHSTDIFFGVPTSQFFCLFAPLMPDHLILLNQLNGGYIMQAMLRRSRWRAIDKGLKELHDYGSGGP